VNRVSFPG